MLKKSLETIVSSRRIDNGRLLGAATVCYPIAIPANLIDLLDQISVEVLVRFQHFEETAVLDAFFHVVEGALDGQVSQRRQLGFYLGQNPLANGGLKHREKQQYAQIIEIVKDRLRVVKYLGSSNLSEVVVAPQLAIPG